jgi:hypothetical protein
VPTSSSALSRRAESAHLTHRVRLDLPSLACVAAAMGEPLDALVRTHCVTRATPARPASAMADAATPQVASIHALSGGTPAEQQQLAAQLKGAEESLGRAAADGGAPLAEALAALDHAQHTLAFIYCLCVSRLAAAHPPPPLR